MQNNIMSFLMPSFFVSPQFDYAFSSASTAVMAASETQTLTRALVREAKDTKYLSYAVAPTLPSAHVGLDWPLVI